MPIVPAVSPGQLPNRCRIVHPVVVPSGWLGRAILTDRSNRNDKKALAPLRSGASLRSSLCCGPCVSRLPGPRLALSFRQVFRFLLTDSIVSFHSREDSQSWKSQITSHHELPTETQPPGRSMDHRCRYFNGSDRRISRFQTNEGVQPQARLTVPPKRLDVSISIRQYRLRKRFLRVA